jgi:PAS domain S-box-containing protein
LLRVSPDRIDHSPAPIDADNTRTYAGAELTMAIKIPILGAIERLPEWVRMLIGCLIAVLSVTLTYSVQPLRAFPLLLAFPTVVLSSWFLGMYGGIACAVVDVILVDAFLTRSQFRFALGSSTETVRLSVFLLVSTFLGWVVGRLVDQRTALRTIELQQRLSLVQAEHQLYQERAQASDLLHERDEALQLALRANGMGLWVWDMLTDTVSCSEEVYRAMGLPPGPTDVHSIKWVEAIHPDDLARVGATFLRARDTGGELRCEFRVVRPDESIGWAECQGTCQRDTDGRVLKIVGVIADITTRKRGEEAMLRAEKLAVAGRLAASVAHEINNPLEAVANLLFLITLSDDAEAAQNHANRALEELLRISLVTQSTLKFHRQSGAPKDTKLSETLDSVLALFRGRLQASGIEVDVSIENESPVECMPGEMQQIFANLVANAVEAMPDAGRLNIRVRPSADWRDRVTEGMRVTICDSGVGMNRATMKRVFEPFFTTKTETGTGLGMWVVVQLLDRHHGHVRMWSSQRPGATGTSFSVFLPFDGGVRPEPAIHSAASVHG